MKRPEPRPAARPGRAPRRDGTSGRSAPARLPGCRCPRRRREPRRVVRPGAAPRPSPSRRAGENLTALSSRLMRTWPQLLADRRRRPAAPRAGRARTRARSRRSPGRSRRPPRRPIATSVGASSTWRSPASSRATLSSVSTIAVSRCASRGDVAEERLALLLPEEDVPAQQRLREAVDRGQRRAQLVRDGRDEVGLHLLDDAAPRRRRGTRRSGPRPRRRVAHDRLGQRQPDLLAAAPDRDQPLAGGALVVRRRARAGAPRSASVRAPRLPGLP